MRVNNTFLLPFFKGPICHADTVQVAPVFVASLHTLKEAPFICLSPQLTSGCIVAEDKAQQKDG